MKAFFSMLILFLLANPCDARWLNGADADVAYESEITKIVVKANGQATIDSHVQIKILNENGRNSWGTLRFNYSPKNTRMKVLGAETRNPTSTFKVGDNDIVDTAIQATENGFDESRQILVSFPQVQVGSVLVFQTKEEIFKPLIDGEFSVRSSVGNVLFKNLDFQIESERPLSVETNDPEKSLVFSQSQGKGKYHYQFSLSKPIFRVVVEEVRALVPEELHTWFVVSTAPTYQTLYKNLADRYEKLILDSPLPEAFRGLVERARAEPDAISGFNLVLASLAETVRYMGDWRAIDGGIIPRSLEHIAKTRFGDCKDMALLTTKILRELGHPAFVALVYRGLTHPADSQVPYVSAFNHAIVSVELNGRKLWLDPTNFQSFAQGVFEDIAERKALVLNPKKLEFEDIHFAAAENSTEQVSYQTTFRSVDRIEDWVDYKVNGSSALRMTGSELRYSKERIQEGTIFGTWDQADILNYRFGPMDLKDRVVKPIRLTWSVDRRYQPTPTSMGPGYVFRAPDLIYDFNKLAGC